MPYPASRGRQRSELHGEYMTAVHRVPGSPRRITAQVLGLSGLRAVEGRSMWIRFERGKIAGMLGVLDVPGELKPAVAQVSAWLRSRP